MEMTPVEDIDRYAHVDFVIISFSHYVVFFFSGQSYTPLHHKDSTRPKNLNGRMS